MNRPLVSIIVPVYNTTEYLEDCIRSVLSQSYENIELVLVNDGSTDGSGEICKQYSRFPNVLYFEQEHSGVTIARKKGVEEANGEWVLFVDSDDLLLPQGLEKLLALSDGCDIVISKHFTSRGLLNSPDYLGWEDYLYWIYSISTGLSPWAKLFKKQLILNSPHAFEYNLIRAQDNPMNLAIAQTNRKNVAICREPVYFYRQRATSTVHTVPFTFDYCYNLCQINDSLLDDSLSQQKIILGGIEQRLHYYWLILQENGYQGNKNHPYVRDLIQRMNEARLWRISDRLILSVSNKTAMKICIFLAKIVRRIETPSLVFSDYQRLFKKQSLH